MKAWLPKLQLADWDIEVHYMGGDEDYGDGKSPAANISILWAYKTATMRIFPCFWSERPERQEKILVHELVHCVTNPLDELVSKLLNGEFVSRGQENDIREFVTQHVTNIVFGNR